MIAITDLVFDADDHEPGDDPKRVAAGTEVKESDFPAEVWEHFVANGSVAEAPGGDKSKDEEIARLQAEITRLREAKAAEEATKPLGDGEPQDVSDPNLDPAKLSGAKTELPSTGPTVTKEDVAKSSSTSTKATGNK